MRNKEKNFISAVIYVYNAETRVSTFLQGIMHIFEANFEHTEIICVNDCSDDDSTLCIKQLSYMAQNVNVEILNLSYFHGLETAMNAGIELAIGDFVFEFDNTIMDFTEDDVMKIYNKALEGYDIVGASSDGKENMWSHTFYFLFDKFADMSYQMHTESFRILSRRLINRIDSMNKSVPYRKAIYARCGLKADNLVYHRIAQNESHELDKREKRYRKTLAIDSLLLFTKVGYHFSVTMTVMMMIMAIFMVVYSVVTYLLNDPVEGWTTTILFLSFAFFGLFAVLSVVIKYLQLLLDLVFRRRRYNFESIEKLN